MRTTVDRIVLAYSGGQDTSAAIPWLKAHYRAEVVAMTLDIGQGNDLESIRHRAISAGAQRAHVLDVREEFVRDFMLPAIKADAMHEDDCRVAKALTRLIVARKLVEMAAIEHATAVSYGCGGGASDQAQLDFMIRALNPALKVIPSVRDCTSALAAEAPAEATINVGTARSDSAREPASVEIAFERGVPVAINGVDMSIADMICSLATIAGARGVGPAAVILHSAHHELQKLVVSEEVTGAIQLQLFKNRCRIIGGRSSFACGGSYGHEESLVANS